jgi:hypothetical protein
VGESLGLFVKDWGPESLLALAIVALLFGYLETRWSVNKKISLVQASRDEALEREKYLRSANEKLQETVRLQAEQLDDLMEQSRTVVALVRSIESSAQAPKHGRHSSG